MLYIIVKFLGSLYIIENDLLIIYFLFSVDCL